MTHRRRFPIVLAALVAAGCGGSSTEDEGRDAGPDTKPETAPGDGQAGCNALGTWEVTYASADAGMCSPDPDTITVEADGDGGVVVNWAGRKRPSTCTYPDAGDDSTYESPASLSSDGCTLTAASHASWCMSGEDQCDRRDLTLEVAGDAASGTVTYSRCWCMGPGPSSPADYAATAVRVP
jgi:hypothetical protein